LLTFLAFFLSCKKKGPSDIIAQPRPSLQKKFIWFIGKTKGINFIFQANAGKSKKMMRSNSF
jgi:hypothetical protein